MTLYYVYLKFCLYGGTPNATTWRWMITFESRYVADEFFRKIMDCLQIDGNPRLVFLERETPQFWCFGCQNSQYPSIYTHSVPNRQAVNLHTRRRTGNPHYASQHAIIERVRQEGHDEPSERRVSY